MMEKEDGSIELNFVPSRESEEPVVSPSSIPMMMGNDEEEDVKVHDELRSLGNYEEDEVKVHDELRSLARPTGLRRACVMPRRLIRFGNMAINDHFTLTNPSSTVNFNKDQAVILVDNCDQMVLEKKEHEDYFTVSQTTVSSPSLFLIRTITTMVAFLMAGFLVVFSVQLILFLFLGLTIHSGEEESALRLHHDVIFIFLA